MNFDKKNNIYKISMIIIVTVLVTFLITSIIFYNYYIKTNTGNIDALTKYITISDSTKSLEKKIEILKRYLENEYMGELDEEAMTESALKGYVAGLGDEYTEYLTEDELEELMVSVNGNYVGIGIYMTQNEDDEIVVLLPIEGSPAETAGLQTGDIIKKVDGIECKGLELTEVSNMVKGEEGTTVNLEIEREEDIFSVDIERRTVELKYIDSEVLEDNIGYIQMISFDEGCSSKFKEELEKLKAQNIKSLIIDLRDNGGGLVTEAIATSEIFVPLGNIILKSYDKDGNETVTKSSNINTEKIKIVVLVNENSASATEIFAAAIQDNEVGTIIGTKTFGKGVMQEVQPLKIGGALKITIEEFKTPKGNKIHEVGITPDIEVDNEKDQFIISIEEDKQLKTAIEYLKKQ